LVVIIVVDVGWFELIIAGWGAAGPAATVGGGGAGRWTVSWLTEQAVAMPTTAIATMGKLFMDNSSMARSTAAMAPRLHGAASCLQADMGDRRDPAIGTQACLPI
jgi:hypothetical protein